MIEIRRLKSNLKVSQTEEVLQKMWHEVDRRRKRKRYRPSVSKLWIPVSVAAASIGVFLFLLLILGFDRPQGNALHLVDNQIFPDTVVSPTTTEFTFADRSRMIVAPHTHLDSLVNSGSNMTFALRRGKIKFEVTPGGNRKWQVHCGAVLVTVTGTVFEVNRTSEFVSVSVSRGEVLVAGNVVPDGVQRLTRDMRIQVPMETDSVMHTSVTINHSPLSMQTAAKNDVTRNNSKHNELMAANSTIQSKTKGEAPLNPGVVSASEEPRLPSESRNSWQALASEGRFDQAYASLPKDVFSDSVLNRMPASELFLLADTARAAGHSDNAVYALRRIIGKHSNDPNAGIAAYTLGKIEMDTLNNSANAAKQFETALKLGISGGFAETAVARLVEANKGLSKEETVHWARYYIAKYPNGRYLEAVTQIMEESTPERP